MKADRLFLERNCSHCGVIRAVLNPSAAGDDAFRGPQDQSLHVIVSQSNEASKELLAKFGHEGKVIPLLVTHDGEVLEDSEDIVTHLKNNRMAT